MRALIENDAERQKLVGNPAAIPNAVEEMLRCLQQHLNRLDEKVNRIEKNQPKSDPEQ